MAVEHLDTMRQMKHRKPFVPFRILTTTGTEYTVEDALQFAVATNAILCYLTPTQDRFVELKAEQIESIHSLEQKPAA